MDKVNKSNATLSFLGKTMAKSYLPEDTVDTIPTIAKQVANIPKLLPFFQLMPSQEKVIKIKLIIIPTFKNLYH